MKIMNINVKTVGDITVVELIGEVDANTAPEVQQQVLPLALPQSKILLNMSEVPYMSSAGLRMLLSLYRQASAKDGQLVLVGLAQEIYRTMSVTGFLNFFTTCETQEIGLELLR